LSNLSQTADIPENAAPEAAAMKDSIRQRLQKLAERFEEVGRLLATDEVAGGSSQFRELSVEYARLQPLAESFDRYRDLERDLAAAHDLEDDPDAAHVLVRRLSPWSWLTGGSLVPREQFLDEPLRPV